MVLGGAGRRVSGGAAALAVAGLLSGAAEGQDPSPSPSPSPSPAPKRLRLDIDRLVKERFEEDERKGIPRFETHVEVVGKSPQAMIDRFFGGIEYDCTPGGAPPGGGAPTHVEMREARWHPSPSADFEAALLMLLAKTF